MSEEGEASTTSRQTQVDFAPHDSGNLSLAPRAGASPLNQPSHSRPRVAAIPTLNCR